MLMDLVSDLDLFLIFKVGVKRLLRGFVNFMFIQHPPTSRYPTWYFHTLFPFSVPHSLVASPRVHTQYRAWVSVRPYLTLGRPIIQWTIIQAFIKTVA